MRLPTLVLASTSPYRHALLERLGLPFIAVAPQLDEARQAGESARSLVVRLAEAKARAVAPDHPGALIIGSDQVAAIEDRILGKPGDRERAIEQLTLAAGKTVAFHTGLCLLNSATGRARTVCELFRVHFRRLSPAQIVGYVDREHPFDCAGGFKSEGLGIALFERLDGDDPNALVGLPLIRLVDLLAAEGVDALVAPRPQLGPELGPRSAPDRA
jgi:septum formation protein